MDEGFRQRFSQPGEAETRRYLAELGWPTEPGPGGGPPLPRWLERLSEDDRGMSPDAAPA